MHLFKICNKCHNNLPLFDFSRDKSRRDGLRYTCKECDRKRKHEWYYKDLEKTHTRQRNYRSQNREQALLSSKKYYQSHRVEKREYVKKNKAAMRRRQKIRENHRLASDINYRLTKRLRTRLYLALRKEWKSGSAVKDLGCTISQLKQWLEQQFQPGMTWDNYGEWHIDHVIPLSSFDLSNSRQLKKACHWFNLQPLWADDNIRKGGHVE